MAMAEEGERATERHAMRRHAASFCAGASAPKKGMKASPSAYVAQSTPEYVSSTSDVRMMSTCHSNGQ